MSISHRHNGSHCGQDSRKAIDSTAEAVGVHIRQVRKVTELLDKFTC
jgi:hypothetical protein